MYPSLRKWLQIAFLNLMLVAILGVVLRYKIIYSLPIVNQKYLLHAHSHFAFAGWLSQVLMPLLIFYLSKKSTVDLFPKFRWILYANLVTAYGMLITFSLQGYGFMAICFSTLSVFVSYFFCVAYWKELKKIKNDGGVKWWFFIALLSNVLSSLGPFSLAYMMATGNSTQHWYLASIYYFLHFQYNGWFFFACMGLLHYQLIEMGVVQKPLNNVFKLFALALLPSYFLSVLWWPLNNILYWIVTASAIGQLIAWWILLKTAWPHRTILKNKYKPLSVYLFLLFVFALSIKLLLQAGSVIPSISDLAFGFRPIVIGYLHLVLLGVITVFIFSYCSALDFIKINRVSKLGIIVFVFGIYFNELILMIQGVTNMDYVSVPVLNPLLLVAAGIMLLGAVGFNVGNSGKGLVD